MTAENQRPVNLRAGLVYVGMAMMQRASAFLVIPFLTQALTRSEYGQISLLSTLSALATVAFGLGLETQVFRAQVRDGEASEGRASVVTYLLVVAPTLSMLSGGVVLVCGLTMLGCPAWAVAAALVSAGMSAPVFSLLLPLTRAQEWVRRFASAAGISTVAQIAGTLVFVVVLDQGLAGWARATLLASGVSLAVSLVAAAPALAPRGAGAAWFAPRLPSLRSALSFSLPMVPHQVFMWAVAFVDRWLIIAITGIAAAGLYALAYQASLVLALVLTEMNRATMRRYATASEEDAEMLGRVIRGQYVVMAAVSACAVMAAPLVTPLVFRGDFGSAADLLPWLFVSQLLYGCYFPIANVLTLTRGMSQAMWRISGVGVIVNVSSNLVLLPLWGVWAAVAASSLAYVAMVAAALQADRSHGDTFGRALRCAGPRTVGMAVLGAIGVTAASAIGGLAFVVAAVVTAGLVVGAVRPLLARTLDKPAGPESARVAGLGAQVPLQGMDRRQEQDT